MVRRIGRRPALALVSAMVCGWMAAGCSGPSAGPTSGGTANAPAGSEPRPAPARDDAGKPEVSFDTERDGRYARFLQHHSGGLIRKAAVGIERRGELRVEISRAVEPDDTLTLTKSLMAGARKDFPDRPITLALYDPDGAPILKANYRPGAGVHYQIAHGGEASPPKPSASADAIERGGVTDRDRDFAAWAESHGRGLLRYVEADLERHGRLWFGVSRDVAPAEVRPLTKSLLEGARKEFPRGELSATAFDPDGERIGRARLGRDGDVRWEQ